MSTLRLTLDDGWASSEMDRRLDAVEERGTAPTKAEAEKAAKSCAEKRQINTVVQERN
jgi:hypothetical protein